MKMSTLWSIIAGVLTAAGAGVGVWAKHEQMQEDIDSRIDARIEEKAREEEESH